MVDEQSGDLFATFKDQLQQSSTFFQHLIGPLDSLTDATLEAIGASIQDGTLLTCSDCSPETGLGSHAWLFADKEGHILWGGGAGLIDGNSTMVTAYRSEFGGITTELFLLQQAVEHFNIHWVCDVIL